MACENDKCEKYGLHHDYKDGVEIRKCFACERDEKPVIGDCQQCDKVLYEGDVAWGFPHSDVFECHDCYKKDPDDLERGDENGMDKR